MTQPQSPTLSMRQFMLVAVMFAASAMLTTEAFSLLPSANRHQLSSQQSTTVLSASGGRSSPNYGKDRSKRQERVGHLVRSELSGIIHGGIIKGDAEYLDDDLRKRISVVSTDISPDLRQARISVSVRAGKKGIDSNPAVDKRRAYAWLVRNTKPIRHTLAQRMSHMKSCPDLSFVQVDVAAAVDVMYLIDKVTSGYKRDNNDLFEDGVVNGIDFNAEFDEDDWEDDDDDDDEDFF
jgi:ribosome-binding factor A